MKNLTCLIMAVVLASLTIVCQRQTPLDTRATDERAIRDAEIEWSKAATAKDLERLLSFYADDASVFPPNLAVVTGKQALRSVWSQALASPGYALSWQATKVEVSRAGDLAYSVGTYEGTTRDPKGKPVTNRGKYVVVWKKQPDGHWKAVIDIFNSDLPAQTTSAQ